MTATSRHVALCGTVADMTAPGRSSADARLISLYSKLAALNAEFDELFARCTTIAEEEAAEPEADALYARKARLMKQIEAVGPPQTLAGIVVVARAALAAHYRFDSDGTAVAGDDNEWLLLTACEALVARA
jgi:hypothetical protein